uniref:Nuclear pore complex protein Nup85 n=1 Tax=Macrostomum lignano TaxID=282301 RepID=A0A1I8JIY8_9PLAT
MYSAAVKLNTDCLTETHRIEMHGDQASSSSGGRKGRLDHNVLAYYRETLRNLDEMRSPSWGNPDDYEQLLSTAFDSLAREGRQLAQNQTGSRLAESLINLADWPGWPACSTTSPPTGLQLLATGRGEADAAGSADDDGAVDGEPLSVESDPSRLWGTFAAHMRLHYPEYLEHPYACHTLRSYLLLIGGVLVSANPTAPSGSSFNKHDSYDPSSSVLVDPPLEFDGISLTEELDGLCSRFLENKHVLVPSLLCSSTGCYFLEQLVSLLSPKQLRKFASAHIAGKEAALALHPSANFVLQRLATADPPPGDWLAKLVASAVGDSPGAGWLSEAMRQSPGRQQQL